MLTAASLLWRLTLFPAALLLLTSLQPLALSSISSVCLKCSTFKNLQAAVSVTKHYYKWITSLRVLYNIHVKYKNWCLKCYLSLILWKCTCCIFSSTTFIFAQIQDPRQLLLISPANCHDLNIRWYTLQNIQKTLDTR